MDDIFKDENKPASNWFKFEKVGDRVSGELVEVTERPASGEFATQLVYTLLQSDGLTVNVGIKKYKDEKGGDLTLSYVCDRLRHAKSGDKVGFMFEKEIPPTQKGFRPAKSIQPYLVEGAPKDKEAF